MSRINTNITGELNVSQNIARNPYDHPDQNVAKNRSYDHPEQNIPRNIPYDYVSQNVTRNIPYDYVSQNVTRNIPHDHDSQNKARDNPYDRVNQNDTSHRPRDQSENRYIVGLDQTGNAYATRAAARNHIPPEATTHRWVRSTIPDVDPRPNRDTVSQQVRDMASMISQLASEVLPLKSIPTPPATVADNNSLSPLAPKTVSLPPTVVPTPLPIPPVVPTGEPVHYTSGARPKRQHTVKLDNYTGKGAPLAAVLDARYEIENAHVTTRVNEK